MKVLFALVVTLICLPQVTEAASVEDCKARAALNQSYKLHELNRSKSGASMDEKFLIDRQIQNVEVQIIGDQAACEEVARYAKADDEYSSPRKVDDDRSEVDFNNDQE